MSALVRGRLMFLNAQGQPLAAGWVFVYQYGTTTLATVYQDLAETIPISTSGNLNVPNGAIPLDASGTAVMFATGQFSFAAYDMFGNPVPGESGPVEGLVSPAMSAVVQAPSVGSALSLLGGLASSGTSIGYTEQSQGVSTIAQTNISYVATANLTLTLPASGTAGTKFAFQVFANGGGVGLQPQATDSVQGQAVGVPFIIEQSQSAQVVTDGAGHWWVMFLTPSLLLNYPLLYGAGSSGVVSVGAGINKLEVVVWGGGGGGGAAISGWAGGGGGGGGFVSSSVLVSSGQSLSFTVGTGGVPTGIGNTPAQGGNTVFNGGSATGGYGGAAASGASLSSGSNGLGGSGGAGVGGSISINLSGQPGGAGGNVIVSSSAVAGQGGAGGGTVMFGGTVVPLNAAGLVGWSQGTGGTGAAGATSSAVAGGSGAGGAIFVVPKAV